MSVEGRKNELKRGWKGKIATDTHGRKRGKVKGARHRAQGKKKKMRKWEIGKVRR